MITALIVVVSVSIAVSALCSILEAVFLSATPSYVATLAERGDRAGLVLQRLRSRLDEPIAAILTLNTVAHTVGAAMGGALALSVFGDAWVAIFSAILTLLILVFSEIIPKTIGARYWRRLSRPTAYVLDGLTVLTRPVWLPLSAIGRLFVRKSHAEPTIGPADVLALAAVGRREGAIDPMTWQVVRNALALHRVAVRRIMTPRTSIVGVSSGTSVAEARRIIQDAGHLRLPVHEGSIDFVVGVVMARDLWRKELTGEELVKDLMRPPLVVPDSKPVDRLLVEMRRDQVTIAIVLDEFGGTAGLVTIEDLVEEVVGEIREEHEPPDTRFTDLPGGHVLVRGDAPVRAVNERLDLDLPEDVVDTLGGFVLDRLGRVAVPGDRVIVHRGALRVEATADLRVVEVVFEPEGTKGAMQRVPVSGRDRARAVAGA
jgi:putative hemolysin